MDRLTSPPRTMWLATVALAFVGLLIVTFGRELVGSTLIRQHELDAIHQFVRSAAAGAEGTARSIDEDRCRLFPSLRCRQATQTAARAVREAALRDQPSVELQQSYIATPRTADGNTIMARFSISDVIVCSRGRGSLLRFTTAREPSQRPIVAVEVIKSGRC